MSMQVVFVFEDSEEGDHKAYDLFMKASFNKEDPKYKVIDVFFGKHKYTENEARQAAYKTLQEAGLPVPEGLIG